MSEHKSLLDPTDFSGSGYHSFVDRESSFLHSAEQQLSLDNLVVNMSLGRQDSAGGGSWSGKLYRRESVSEAFDELPPSVQISTNIKGNRPREDFLTHAAEMGFSTAVAERAFIAMLESHSGNPEAFTLEDCIQYIFAHSDSLEMEDDSSDDALGVSVIADTGAEVDDAFATEDSKVSDESPVEMAGASSTVPSAMALMRTDSEAKEDAEDSNYTGAKRMCVVCATDRPTHKFVAGACGHSFCRRCMTTYLESQIEEGVVTFVCMDGDCERGFEEAEVFEFIDSDHQSKLKRFERNVQLAKDPNVRWCVKPGCDTPLFRKTKKQRKLMCEVCAEAVCYACASAWHGDTPCDLVLDQKLEKWCKEEVRDVQHCPACFARIEKLQGCNHMTCSYCKYEFCWLCRRKFKKGHYDRSNLFGGCPGGENAMKKPNKCYACCDLTLGCCLTCVLPARVCWWHMEEQGLPWCLCWYCCD